MPLTPVGMRTEMRFKLKDGPKQVGGTAFGSIEENPRRVRGFQKRDECGKERV